MSEIVEKIKAWCQEQGWIRMVEHGILLFALYKLFPSFTIQSRGKTGFKNYIHKMYLRIIRKFSSYEKKLDQQLTQMSKNGAQKALAGVKVKGKYSTIPLNPLSKDEILNMLDQRIKTDLNPSTGRNFALIYQVSKQHNDLTQACFAKYVHSTALNPIAFNSVRVIESEVVRMTANMLNGDENCVGNVTSCGTQSLLLAMKTYRDYRGPGDVIMCVSGHPGINKGCNYVGLNCVQIPYDQTTKRMSLKHLKSKISSKTVVVVCSAPQYPHGVVDDVQEIAKICKSYGVPLHVDSAIGGYILPWIQRLRPGKLKPWDFRVDGVCSMNTDCHKYGYAPKGSSVLVYRNSEIRRCQFYSFMTWPGGIYISPTALGTRNGGSFSSALGSLLGLGQSGLLKIAENILQVIDKLTENIKNNQQLELMAIPDSSIIAFRTKNFSCYKLADAMNKRGFTMEKQFNPECLHMTIMPTHHAYIQKIIDAMNQSVQEVKNNPDMYENETKAVYGMMANLPDEEIAQDYIRYYMDEIFKYRE